MLTASGAVVRIIHAIGRHEFPSVAAMAACEVVGFELAALIVHGRGGPSVPLFDNFDRFGGRQGLQTYCRITHAINPMLKAASGRHALRASDFSRRHWEPKGAVGRFIEAAPDEELGFRTIGWPARLEEVGLYFESNAGTVELSLYRERARSSLGRASLGELQHLAGPISAAFERHRALDGSPVSWREKLTAREFEVVQLLLLGCSTEAIELRLALSPHTVKDYRKRIYRKLGVCSLAELFALRRADETPLWGDR